MKKEQNGRESLRRLKIIVGCNAIKRRRRILNYILEKNYELWIGFVSPRTGVTGGFL